jgi:anaerobic ribonucleoside-triphosphate reductase
MSVKEDASKMKFITKRDGRVVPYDETKIRVALKIAIMSSKLETDAEEAIDNIITKFNESFNRVDDSVDTLSVEDIQDMVVDAMKSLGYNKLAKSFTAYRNKRTRTRERKSNLSKSIREVATSSAKDSDAKRENGNIDGDTAMGTMLKFGTTTSKEYYLSEVIPEDISNAHRNGYIHIHDLDFYALTTTCTQIGLKDLLKTGFSTGHGYLRTPQDIITAGALACITIQSNQSDQHGGQSIPMFDYALAPYVAKTFIRSICTYLDMNEVCKEDIDNIREQLHVYRDTHDSVMDEDGLKFAENVIYNVVGTEFLIPGMCIEKAVTYTDKQTYQAMEAVVHNLNTMQSRCGAQVPFSSLNFGTDTSVEGRMVSRNLMLAQKAGLGSGETPIFPILIFKVAEGVNYNPTDPNYDLFKLACEVSAKRLFPNFSFIDAPHNHKYYKKGIPDTEIAYMGCVDGNATLIYKYKGETYNESFSKFYERIKNDIKPHSYNNWSEYYNTYDIVNVYDSSNESFVRCKGLIHNSGVVAWLKITVGDSIEINCTFDHPLPIYSVDGSSRRMRADDLIVGDKILLSNYDSNDDIPRFGTITKIEVYTESKDSFDVETESDRFDVSGINSHNCRTRVISDINDKEHEIVTGRGNLSFTTINLPRLAIEANKDIDKFYASLDDMLELVTRQLLHRYKLQCARTVKNYPFLMGQGVWKNSDKLNITDTLESVLKHGTLSVGFIGLAETLIALTGKHHGESEESQKLGLEIVGHMREYMDRMTEKYSLNFSLLATPAEGLSGRFVRMDAKKYGIIKGVTDKDYYTNSNHVPVYYPISAYKKIQIEAPYHALCNAGHICYVELDGDPSENIEAFEDVIRCMKESGIGYGAINHPVDRDPVCGYVGIIGDTCPCCGRREGEPLTLEVYRNIIGKNRLREVSYGK